MMSNLLSQTKIIRGLQGLIQRNAKEGSCLESNLNYLRCIFGQKGIEAILLKLSTFNLLLYMEINQPAQYCQYCQFPFKQMGACPYPDRSIIWAYLSMVPYVFPLIVLVVAIFTRKMAHLKMVVLMGSAYIVGDKIVKNIIKSPRPAFACKKSYGMPSSHMTVVLSIFLSRLTPKEVHVIEKLFWLLITVLQAFARVYLNYHSWEQVIGGTIFGAVYTFLFDRLWDAFVSPYLSEHFPGLILLPEQEGKDK